MRVEQRVEVAAPRDRVWEVLRDPSCYPTFMAGVTRWEPCGSQATMGIGARFNVRMKVGSAEVGSLIELVEFRAPSELAWTSVTGIDQRGRWKLVDEGPRRTRVTLRLSYQSPGGLLSLIADRVAAPMVRRNLGESLRNLKQRVESQASSRAAS